MELYIFLIENGGAYSKEDIISGIENGHMAVAVGWPGWNDPKSSVNSDYIAFPGKVSDDEPSYNSNIYGIWTLGIPENCTDKESAVKLLEYLMIPMHSVSILIWMISAMLSKPVSTDLLLKNGLNSIQYSVTR